MESLDTFGFVSALKQKSPSFRRRLATVVSVQTGYTMTVKIAGDSTSISGVRYFGHVPPKAGSHVWIDTDGADLIGIGAVAGLGGAACAARTTKNAGQTIGTGPTGTLVTFPAADFDPYGIWDNANDKYVIPFDGIWHISAGLEWIANATVAGGRGVKIAKNGTAIAQQLLAGNGSTTNSSFAALSTVINAVKDDAFTVIGVQTSGGSQDVAGTALSYFAIAYIGPAA